MASTTRTGAVGAAIHRAFDAAAAAFCKLNRIQIRTPGIPRQAAARAGR